MNLLKWLLLLRKLDVQELLAYPKDITMSGECRRWVRALLNAADVLTDLTEVKFDDEIVNTLDSIVENNEAWEAIHGLFVSVVAEDAPVTEDVLLSGVETTAVRYGFNPAIIMLIIQAVSLLLKLFRSRRK